MPQMPSDSPIRAPVLVIDDDEFFRVAIDAVLRTRLEVEDVVVCATAEDALQRLSEGSPFGLVLVDLKMPGVDDRRLLGAAKAAQPEVPVVVVSGSRSRQDVLMALSAGAHGFIHKGLGIRELERALRRIAAGSVYVPPFMAQTEDDAPMDEGRPPDAPSATLGALTPRQVEVLRHLVAGQSNKGIARSLDVSQSTVKFHLHAIFRVLGATNRVEAATLGARLLREGG
jgi:DNA-binding NarL/FixJ family response regulator